VDTHIGRHIYEKLISPRGLLKDCTRVLVTHNIQYLNEADLILVMDKGKIIAHGTYQELVRVGGLFLDLLKDFKKDEQQGSTTENSKLDQDWNTPQKPCLPSFIEDHDERNEDMDLIIGDGQLVEEEQVQDGHVNWGIYKDYAQLCGSKRTLFVLTAFIFGQAMHLGSGILMSFWADLNESGGSNSQPVFFLSMLATLGAIEALVAYTRQVTMYNGCIAASQQLHHKVLYRVIHSPMSFLEVTPKGRITNRLSTDLDETDEEIPRQLSDAVWCFFELLSTLVLIAAVSPVLLVPFTVLSGIFLSLVYYFISSSRQLKRLEANGRYKFLCITVDIKEMV